MFEMYRKRPIEKKEQIKERLVEFQIGRFGWLINVPSKLLFGSDLKMLATIYGTDKWNLHWYAQIYEEMFRKIRRKRICLLEIGVGGFENPRKGGNSLRMWRAYFPKARIFGVDLYDKTPHNGKRIRTFRGSQVDSRFLDFVIQEMGVVNLIIDDGSHINEHTIFTFQHLFPRLATGGTYVVEDTQTSYWAEYGGNETGRSDSGTVMNYFKSLADGLNWKEFRGGYHPNYFDLNVESISFYHNLIVVRKAAHEAAADRMRGEMRILSKVKVEN